MAEFNGSLFNDGPFDESHVLGSGGAAGGAHAGCVGTVIKTGGCVAAASADAALRAGLITASTVGVLGAASADCEPARVRKSSVAVIGLGIAPCEGLRMRASAANAAGAAEGLAGGRRLRTCEVWASGVAVLGGVVEKLAFPPLAQGLRVRRWSKPAGVVDLRSSAG